MTNSVINKKKIKKTEHLDEPVRAIGCVEKVWLQYKPWGFTFKAVQILL